LEREVNAFRQQINAVTEQTETARREANTLRLENSQLRGQIGVMTGELNSLNAQLHQQPQPRADQRVNGASHVGLNNGAELPPIRGPFMGDDNMTGVQYHDMAGPPRPNPNDLRGIGFPFGLSPERPGSMYSEPPSPFKPYPLTAPRQAPSPAQPNGLGANKNKHS
jgi:hypothetical protein